MAVATTLLGAGLAALALPATAAAPTTCQGKPVTVTGIVGTEGDDVMLVEPGQYATVRALGGNDLICIVATPLDDWRNLDLDAGPGDDAVVNDSTDVDSAMYSVSLGEGADSYRGLVQPVAADVFEQVYASTYGSQDFWTADDMVDTIETGGGNDTVFTGSSAPGAPNADLVRTGAGADTVHWAGEQTGATLDLGSDSNVLSLHPGWRATSVVVDSSQRIATGDGRPLLRWTGDVSDTSLELDNRDVTFVGTDAADTVRMVTPPGIAVPAGGIRSASLGRGDDSLILQSVGAGDVTGGPGQDRLYLDVCRTARLRLGNASSCVPQATPSMTHTFGLDSFEDLLVKGKEISVRGSDRSEKVKVVAARIRIRGRGGADVLNPNAYFGREAYTTPVVVSGGQGDDRILGSFVDDLLRGGPGDDRLFGQTGDDTILGGTGRDKAVGKAGSDQCSAEVRVSCESR